MTINVFPPLSSAYLTTAALSDHSHGNPTLALTNLSGTTASASNGLTISLSAAAPGAGGSGAALSAGTQSVGTGTVAFANSNGITFGMSNSNQITASHNGLTTAMASNAGSNFIGINTALTANGVSMSANSSGLSLNFPAFLTTAALSGDTTKYAGLGFTTTTTAGTGVVGTQSTNGLSIAFPLWLTTAQAPGAYLTTARASNDAIGLNTALTANGVSMSANSSGLSLNFPAFLTTAALSGDTTKYAGVSSGTQSTAGVVPTMTHNTAGLNLGVPAWITTYANDLTSGRAGVGETVGTVAGTDLGLTVNTDGVSILYPKWLTTAQAPGAYLTTAALSDHSHGNPTLALTNLTGTTASASNGLTISLSAANPGGGAGATASYFRHPNNAPVQGTSSMSFGASSMLIQPFQLPMGISASYVRFPISVGFGSTTFGTAANVTRTLQQTNSYYAIIYSQGAGASSRSIQSVYSSSLSDVLRVIYQIGAASSNQTCSHFLTYGVTGNSSVGFTTGYSPAASSNARISTTHLTAFTGARYLDIPFGTLLTPGNYWMGIGISSASATTGTAAMSAATVKASYYALTQISLNINEMGGNTSAGSNMWQGFGHGIWTTNTNGATTASIALSHVSTNANQPIIPFELQRQA